MNPPRPRTVPPWDLPTVLRALEGPPFEPLQSSSLRVLSLKTAMLLALASVKRVGDGQPGAPALPRQGPENIHWAFCLVQKVRTAFFGFGNWAKDGPVTKQRISRWLVDAITLAYSSSGLQCPIGVRAHSTRSITSSWAWSSGVSISDICEVAGWPSPSTFARFYNLDVPALQARVLSA